MKDGKKNKLQYLPEGVIQGVIANDTEAMELAVLFYDGFMSYMLDRLIRSNQLNPGLVPKEDMMQEIRFELFKAMRNFY